MTSGSTLYTVHAAPVSRDLASTLYSKNNPSLTLTPRQA
jgi:hypothetical protein